MDAIGEAVSIRWNNRVYEMQAAGEDVIVLSLGEAFFDLPLHGLDDLPAQEVIHYSHSRGLPALRDRLAGLYTDRYGVPVDPEREIVVTAGSKIAIHMTLMALLAPGDEAVVVEPAWVSYFEQIRLCHATPVPVPYDVPVTDIERYITPRTRVLILNYPNNPRGQMLSDEEWATLHEIAERRDVFLLCDEAYSEFVPPGERFVSGGAGDVPKRHTVICNSMSKNFGVSGWRIGYVIASDEVITEVLKVNQHLVTCPATILSRYMADRFDEMYAAARPQIDAVVARRAEIAAACDDLGLRHLPGNATFYLFVGTAPSGLGSEEFCDRLLAEHHVAAVPGIGYGESCDGFVRISVGTESRERTLAGVRAIRELIA